MLRKCSSFGAFNTQITEADYDRYDKVLTLEVRPRPNTTISIGLGLVILKINTSAAPSFTGVRAIIAGDNTTDMLKNYTFIDGEFFIRTLHENGTITENYYPCVYLEVYFYFSRTIPSLMSSTSQGTSYQRLNTMSPQRYRITTGSLGILVRMYSWR